MMNDVSVLSLVLSLLIGWGIGVLNVILFGRDSEEKFLLLMKVVPQLTCVVFVGAQVLGWFISGKEGAYWGAMLATLFSCVFTIIISKCV